MKTKCRKKPSAVDRTDVSDVDRTDRLHRQSTFCPTHCAAGDAAPGEAQPGSTLFTHLATWVWWCQQDMGVVAPRGHGICTHWDTQEVSHNPTILSGGLLSFPIHPTCACHPCPSSHLLSLGICVYLYMLAEIGGCPVLLHLIMENTCKQTLGLCGSPKASCWKSHTAP